MEPAVWHAQYDRGVPPSLTYDDLTLHDYLARAVAGHPDRPALLFRNGRLSYAELHDEVERLATALAGFGVEHGTRVAIHLPNLPQTVIAFFATLRLGAVAVITNPLYTSPEIEHQWTDADVRVAITLDALYVSRVLPIRSRLPLEQYIVASIPEYLRFPLSMLAHWKLRRATPPLVVPVARSETVHPFRRLIGETAPAAPEATVGIDDLALLQYTGGTTGVSKGAMLTHRCVSANVQQLGAWVSGLEEGQETWISCLPFFHIYGLTVSMMSAIRVAAAQVLIPNPRDIGLIVGSIVKHRATMCPMVPAMFMGINAHPGIERIDLTSLKVCNSGSAPLPVDVLETFEQLTGARITEGYGLTETSPVTHSNPIRGMRKPGSIGVPLPDTDARIVDLEDGTRDLPPGESGELLLRGPQVFPGYWNRPDETAGVFREGWFCTGDIARMDDDGFFFIVGRKKDMILASGYNIYPDEIDRVLAGHPGIVEAATIGVPDARRGETVKSFVVTAPGVTLSEQEVIDYCRERLAAYKVPRQVEFRDALPRSTVLKVLRRQLRDEEMARADGGA